MEGQYVTLQNYIESLSKLSGMGLCVYDLTYFTYKIDSLYINWNFKSHNSPLCMLTKFSDKRHRDCIVTEHNRLIRASQSKDKFIIDSCQCGLVDIVIPILCGNKLLGGIFLGQVFLDEYPDISLYERYFKDYNDIELEDILREAREVPIKSYQELLYLKDICRLLGEYIEDKIRFYEFKKIASNRPSYVSVIDLLPRLSEPIQRAIDIIRVRVTKGITLEQVADAVGYSPSQFSRRFKMETGMTFSQCIKVLKIELAQYLLKNSDKGICEVAYEVGYREVSSFLRAFKEQTGITPHKWLLHNVPIRARSREELSI